MLEGAIRFYTEVNFFRSTANKIGVDMTRMCQSKLNCECRMLSCFAVVCLPPVVSTGLYDPISPATRVDQRILCSLVIARQCLFNTPGFPGRGKPSMD